MQLPQSHTIQNLMEVYVRVNPILSEWLAKPVWTAEETAMLCAGFVPNFKTSGENPTVNDSRESIEGHTPIDIEGYLQPNYELCRGYLHLLAGKGVASPRDMVDMLCPAMTCVMSEVNQRDGGSELPSLRVLTLDSLRELQWLLIIGNAVGLQVPALIPFDLLNGLRDRLTGQSVAGFPADGKQSQFAPAEPAAKIKPKIVHKKPRGRQPLKMTPRERGYHTTEEVAGLTNLRPDTLNKYAREGIAVEGFTPFKRQNGRSWQWRDGPQQSIHAANAASQAIPSSEQTKSLASLLGSRPFQK